MPAKQQDFDADTADRLRKQLARMGMSSEEAAKLTQTDPRRMRRAQTGNDRLHPSTWLLLEVMERVPGARLYLADVAESLDPDAQAMRSEATILEDHR